MKGKVLILLLVTLTATMAYLYTRPVPAAIRIDKVYNVTNAGDTILVNATLSDVSNCAGWMLNLAWDPTVVNITSGNTTYPADGGPPVEIIEGSFLKITGPTYFIVNSVDQEKGEATIGGLFKNKDAFTSGTGVIFAINFTIIKPGITTVELRPPYELANMSVVWNPQTQLISHDDINGLITQEGPPPAWVSADFQNTTIVAEVAVLATASYTVYSLTHRRPPKAQRRKAELQPIFDPEDER